MSAIMNNRFYKQVCLFALLSQFILGSEADLTAAEATAGFTLGEMNLQSGEAQWATVSNEFQITASDGAHIQYLSGFDIPSGETVRFIQPSAEATVINEILASTPTQIEGNLYGNGKVVLFNSSGIVFGENSVVEVGKLHAIAGSELAPESLGYSLGGSVIAAGSITAGEVVLAGISVTNSGTILVEEGTLVLTAGEALQLFDVDNSLTVEISQELAVTGASDLAGQVLLQSGVLQASKAVLVADTITHSGTTTADSLSVSEFSSFTGDAGSLNVSELSVAGRAAVENASDFSASGENNQVDQLSLSGIYDNFTILSSSSLVEGTTPLGTQEAQDQDLTTHSVQDLDLRVDNGDLTLNSLFAPTDANSDNSLLLAAENNLNLAGELDLYTHVRKILYGRNLTVGSIANEDELSFGSTVSLDAISVFIDDLSSTLSPSVIQSLALDNPTFEGFDSQGGLLELAQMTESQLTTLFKYGLFTGYSYFLQAPDKSAKLSEDLSEAGGSSALFGGSFAVVASAGASVGSSSSSSSSTASSGEDGGGSDDSSGDSEGDSEGDAEDGDGDSDDSSGGDGGGTSSANAKTTGLRAAGVAPFAPISKPILSFEAAEILDQALAPEIEQRMEKYLKP